MRSSASKMTFAAVALLLGQVVPALAQTAASAAVVDQAASGAKPADKAAQKKQLKAQRKAERKEAHAKNAAELKKLEAQGYRPGMNDPNYPQSLQDAQKKAAASGASQ
ncbi:DUF4148 domain-containing protein [Paraburkholderia haematera]|uniref:DUF4148 domain-containing protein n=1 Tax=Paraburkholderia haematera TaxID=2793077 RepID=A0ABN7MRW9_9BURK|nr:DUF4148 domain-containing protein [Paraburkholderia haematera]CAE6825808.1 hypothetical protein R69888_06332 [Paraburkholderia haematera]